MAVASDQSYRLVLVMVLLVSSGGLLTPSVESASGPTPIDSCTTITEPGEYVLTSDVDGREVRLSQSCLRIAVSDVRISGNGHRIRGIGVSDTTGIAVNGTGLLRNVTIQNVTVTGWNRGIYLENVTRSTVSDVTARQNAFGITLHDVSYTTIRNCRFSLNLVDIYRDDDSRGNAVENAASETRSDVQELR
jgi:parallel beta-helix repeat protein